MLIKIEIPNFRAVSGIYEKSLIVNLPGSKKAAEECLLAIANVIPHAINLIKDEKEISKHFHTSLNSVGNIKSNVPVSMIIHFEYIQ